MNYRNNDGDEFVKILFIIMWMCFALYLLLRR